MHVTTVISAKLRDLLQNPNRCSTIEIWKNISASDREAAAMALLKEDENFARQALANAIATQFRMRVPTAMNLPVEKVAFYAARSRIHSVSTGERLLISYHLQTKRAMLARFLDLVGIRHENGLIEDELNAPAADAEHIRMAVAIILDEYGPYAVAVYGLSLFTLDHDAWREVPKIVEHRFGFCNKSRSFAEITVVTCIVS